MEVDEVGVDEDNIMDVDIEEEDMEVEVGRRKSNVKKIMLEFSSSSLQDNCISEMEVGEVGVDVEVEDNIMDVDIQMQILWSWLEGKLATLATLKSAHDIL